MPSSVYCGTGGTADIFTFTCCIAHLPRSCEKEALGSSLGIITGSNPLPKASKTDISLSFYTLPRSAILTRFAPYCEAGLTLLRNPGSTWVHPALVVPCEHVNPGSTRVHPTFAGPCERGISPLAGEGSLTSQPLPHRRFW